MYVFLFCCYCLLVVPYVCFPPLHPSPTPHHYHRFPPCGGARFVVCSHLLSLASFPLCGSRQPPQPSLPLGRGMLRAFCFLLTRRVLVPMFCFLTSPLCFFGLVFPHPHPSVPGFLVCRGLLPLSLSLLGLVSCFFFFFFFFFFFLGLCVCTLPTPSTLYSTAGTLTLFW